MIWVDIFIKYRERKKERYICRKAHIIHGTFSLLIPLEPSHATMSAPKCWVHSQTPHIVIFRVQFSVRSRLDYSLSSSLYANIIIFETQISYPTGEDKTRGIARCRKNQMVSQQRICVHFPWWGQRQTQNTNIYVDWYNTEWYLGYKTRLCRLRYSTYSMWLLGTTAQVASWVFSLCHHPIPRLDEVWIPPNTATELETLWMHPLT